MSAAAVVTKAITTEINALATGRYDEVIFDDSLLADFPDPEYFMSPDPDVHEGPDHERLLDELAEHPSLLGVYIPMRSHGRVILIERNLRRFYWSLVRQVRHGLPYLTPLDLHGALDLVVMKTYQHELFHFHCDVLRQLLGGQYDRWLEEALAVAWSRLKIIEHHGNSKIGRMNRVFYHRLLDAAFAYRSPGYSDWVKFPDATRFNPKLLDYLAGSAGVARLQANGVANLPDLLFGLIGKVAGGYVEEVA